MDEHREREEMVSAGAVRSFSTRSDFHDALSARLVRRRRVYPVVLRVAITHGLFGQSASARRGASETY